MNKKRKIRFDYGRIYTYQYQPETKEKINKSPLPLEQVLNIAIDKSIKDRTKPYYGEDVILQKIDKIENGLWKLQFIKQRSAETPGIIDKKTDDYKKLDLDESQYVGEDVAVLYHEETNVLMIQRNRSSIGIGGLEEYFRKIINSDRDMIEIKLVPFTNNLNDLKKLLIRKVEVSFADVNVEQNKDSSLLSIISGAKRMRSVTTKVSFSVGRGGEADTLTQDEVMEFTNLNEDDGFRKVHVEYKLSEDSPVEKVEFINGKLFDEMKFEYSKENKIHYERVIDAMLDIFKKRKDYLKEIFVGKI